MMNLCGHLDAIGRLRAATLTDLVALGWHYPEIKQFQRMQGIGVV